MERNNDAGTQTWVAPDDAPELDDTFFAEAELFIAGPHVPRRGRRPNGNAKELVSLRLDQDVRNALRASGPGWQTRVNETLRRTIGLAEPPV